MTKTFNCIVMRSGEVIWRPGVSCHDELIEAVGLKDDTYDRTKMKFARVRILPSGNVDVHYLTEPYWFNDRHEKAALVAFNESKGHK